LSKFTRLLSFLWFPALVLVLWELSGGSVFFPAPSTLYSRILEEVTMEWLLKYLAPTLGVFSFGYILGLIIGLGLGTLVGSSKVLYESLIPVLVFIRKMPSVAKLPIVIAIVGLGLNAQLAAVTIAVAFLMALVSAKATYEPDGSVDDTTLLFRFNPIQRIFLANLPSRAELLATTAKSGIQLALVLTILSETLVSSSGIGAYTLRAKSLFDLELMWIGIIVVGLVGFLLHEIFTFAERQIPLFSKKRNE
jgi:ABC-type nitrate/sulfonate/bicarbonate transport system permease component